MDREQHSSDSCQYVIVFCAKCTLRGRNCFGFCTTAVSGEEGVALSVSFGPAGLCFGSCASAPRHFHELRATVPLRQFRLLRFPYPPFPHLLICLRARAALYAALVQYTNVSSLACTVEPKTSAPCRSSRDGMVRRLQSLHTVHKTMSMISVSLHTLTLCQCDSAFGIQILQGSISK